MLEGERVAALPENDQLRGTPILVTDRRGDAWTTTLTDVEATPRSWSPIPAATRTWHCPTCRHGSKTTDIPHNE